MRLAPTLIVTLAACASWLAPAAQARHGRFTIFQAPRELPSEGAGGDLVPVDDDAQPVHPERADLADDTALRAQTLGGRA
jgi:hypothetical protein